MAQNTQKWAVQKSRSGRPEVKKVDGLKGQNWTVLKRFLDLDFCFSAFFSALSCPYVIARWNAADVLSSFSFVREIDDDF